MFIKGFALQAGEIEDDGGSMGDGFSEEIVAC